MISADGAKSGDTPCRTARFVRGVTILMALAFAVASAALRKEFVHSQPAAEVDRGPIGLHRVALTFDAGGETDGFPALLLALEQAKVHATFFLTGRWALLHPDLTEEIYRQGHEIGNHSWSHPDLTKLDDAEVRTQILHADAILSSVINHSPRPLFRAPFGARDSRILRILAENGYRSIYWNLDSLDSIEPRKTPEYLVARITHQTDAALDGAIILMHIGEPATAQAVPQILRDLRRRGFRQVTVSEFLR